MALCPKPTTLPSETFRFLDLPLEIRRLVYKELLGGHRGTIRLFHRDAASFYVRPPGLHVDILRCSKSIHEEAANVLYGANVFCIVPSVKLCFAYCLPRIQINTGISSDMVEHLEQSSSGATLKSMGRRNRAKIRHVEIALPRPWEVCAHNLESMKRLFPRLSNLSYFFLWPNGEEQKPAFNAIQKERLLRLAIDFYPKFFSYMPKALRTRFDFSVLEHIDDDYIWVLQDLIMSNYERFSRGKGVKDQLVLTNRLALRTEVDEEDKTRIRARYDDYALSSEANYTLSSEASDQSYDHRMTVTKFWEKEARDAEIHWLQGLNIRKWTEKFMVAPTRNVAFFEDYGFFRQASTDRALEFENSVYLDDGSQYDPDEFFRQWLGTTDLPACGDERCLDARECLRDFGLCHRFTDTEWDARLWSLRIGEFIDEEGPTEEQLKLMKEWWKNDLSRFDPFENGTQRKLLIKPTEDGSTRWVLETEESTRSKLRALYDPEW